MHDAIPAELLLLGMVAMAWATATIARTPLVPALALILAAAGWRPSGARRTPQAAPAGHPLAQVGEELQALPVPQLRSIIGCRRRLRKQALIDLVLAG